MTKVVLQSLRVRNFAGLREFKLVANGKDVTVSACNGRGKTTLVDSAFFVLTGKDSLGNSPGPAFPIKTRDENHEFLHGLEHEAEVVLDIDGREMSFKKVYKEKWTRKRGTNDKIFDGHETDHYVDGVPKTEKEYQARLARIADERTWRLLIDPLFFAQDRKGDKFDWRARRALLFEMCGSMTDGEIIAATPKLAALPGILKGRDIEDHKAVVKSQLKKIKDEIEQIPIRISEAQLGLPDVTGLKIDKVTADISTAKYRLQEKQQELARIQSGGQAAELKRALAEAQAELIKAQNEAGAEVRRAIQEKQRLLDETADRGNDLNRQIKEKEADIAANNRVIESRTKGLELLSQTWQSVDGNQFVFEQEAVCPICGQAIPEEQLQEARQKAEEAFNLNKAQKLEEINKKGEAAADEIDELVAANTKLQAEIDALNEKLQQTRQEYAAIQEGISNLKNLPQDLFPGTNPEIVKVQSRIFDLEIAISDLEGNNQEAITTVHGEINAIQAEIDALEGTKKNIEAFDRGQKRIAELGADEKRLAKEYEKCESELFLLEEFTRAKCSLITDGINSNFKLARFKLFDVLVNGAVVECCEVIIPSGAGWNSGGSHGEKMRVGVDIINRLQQHFGIIAPIFLDEAESLTEPVETKAQVIRLKAVEGVDKLQVEVA